MICITSFYEFVLCKLFWLFLNVRVVFRFLLVYVTTFYNLRRFSLFLLLFFCLFLRFFLWLSRFLFSCRVFLVFRLISICVQLLSRRRFGACGRFGLLGVVFCYLFLLLLRLFFIILIVLSVFSYVFLLQYFGY